MRRTFTLCLLILSCVFTLSAQSEREITALDWNIDGTKLAIGYSDGKIEIRDFTTGITQNYAEPTATITSLDWNPRHPDLLALSFSEHVWIWNTISDEVTVVQRYATHVHAIEWSHNGWELAGGLREISGQFAVHVWDLEGVHVQSFVEHTNAVLDVAWASLPGRWLTSTSLDGETILWDLDVHLEVFTWQSPQGGIRVMWNPAATEVATLSGDHAIRVWNIDTQDIVRSYEGTAITEMAWSRDGTYIAVIDGEQITILYANTLEVAETIFTEDTMNTLVWGVNYELAFGGTSEVFFYKVTH